MRIGILTSHRVPCGIAQYSERLADALAAAGAEPVILAGRADEHRSVPEESPHEVHDVAKIGLWRDDGQYDLDIEQIVGLGLDVIHVQYQSMLFNQQEFESLGNRFNDCHGPLPMAITFHDKCQRPDFPYGAFEFKFSHRWDVGPADVEVIPFGIENYTPQVRTFGLGRTRSDLIKPICDRNGWEFLDIASHEPIHGGGQQWRTHKDLIEWLRLGDATVLWYDPQSMAGSSQAVRTAMAARRPVITNNTEWFADLPTQTKGYQKVSSLEELEARLVELFRTPYIEANSWDVVAQHLLRRYCEFR